MSALHLVGVVGEGDLVRAAHEVVLVVQRVQRRLEGQQVAVPQVVRVRQAPLAPAVRVAPVVALPAESYETSVWLWVVSTGPGCQEVGTPWGSTHEHV
jgi:hypothetical protein